MIGKILLLALVAASQARHVKVQVESIPYDRCPPVGHYLLPHEWDCTKFYYCEYGQKWLTPRDCAPGTDFSYALQVCVHPAAANCELSGVPPGSEEVTEEPETESPETEATEPDTVATEVPTEAPTEAPTEPETEAPTEAPTEAETEAPTEAPTTPPTPTTEAPTEAPTEPETEAPTEAPTEPETEAPTEAPTTPPTPATEAPTEAPTEPETEAPTEAPTEPETEAPTEAPTTPPTPATEAPTEAPTEPETEAPTEAPTEPETEAPTEAPTTPTPTTEAPTEAPTEPETDAPTEAPTEPETEAPTEAPTTPPTPTTEVSESPEDLEGSGDVFIDNEELLPNGCPADFGVHALLPHESDCSKFYYCVLGETIERQCAEGTLFNAELQVCDWPANVNCSNANSAESGNSEENGIAESSEDNNGVLDNGCPADFDVHQLLPHESDCEKFYYCVRGETVERECPDGLQFNPAIQVCDWPEAAGCDNSGNSSENSGEAETEATTEAPTEATTPPTTPTTAVPETDATTPEAPTEAPTEPGTVAPTEAPTEPETEAPTEAPTTPPSPTTEAPTEPESEAPTTEASTPAPIPTEAPEQELLPNGCPADFDVHQLLPHESDCAKFYYCVFGETVERECPDGLQFNPAIQVCDWPEAAGCANSGNSGENSGEAETEAPTEAPTEATTPPTTPTTAVPETDATTTEAPTEAPTEPGTVAPTEAPTEPETEAPTEAPTTPPSPTTEAPTEPESEAPTTEASTPAPIPTEAPEQELLPNGCPADFDVHQLLPHESDCAKFYYCVFGETVERECPDGLQFNPAIQVCDWPEAAGCANSGNSGENSGEAETEAPTEAPTEVTTPPTAPTTAVPETDATTTEAPTEAPTAPPSPTTEAPTESESEAPTTEASTPAPIPTEAPEQEVLPNGCPADFDVHQLLPHESDCAKFYYCVNGEKVERECSGGLWFNPAIQVCDWPQNAGCAVGGGEESSAEGSAESENGTETDRCRSSCNIPAWAHEQDCDKFWRCDGENAVLGTCSEGLNFNVNTQTCDFISNAGCVGDDVQSTPELEGLKLFLPKDKVDKTIRALYMTGHQ